ncbi:MarR family winged helix-turn-helix transcriptional regulator [Maribacter cobaltidurans]|uniref:MarR family transcriptional regulator n=1 Tax=Maribacter cobaltidurans TaxID=1178778 RepID=A0A223V7U4_9FLAO|nr:MarR family transcriptional regulator [Maribacter cobaltidurans]ASV31287.1 MarR family transcriptional regulator [Maribacter cobaltidurans]GGD83557.1 MarR family transcriptional regulator [Maribacter cobaltidurans]
MNVEEVIKTTKKIPIETRTIIHLSLVSNKVSEMMTCSLKPFGVSIQQFNVLRILRGQGDKPANLSTINDRMVTKMSNTTRLVDKLLSKGYVERQICPENRRKVEIKITKEGLNVLNDIDGIKVETEKKILSSFSQEELKKLNDLLDKF